MALTIAEAFDVKVTTKSVSRVAATGSALLRLFGMQTGGPNVLRKGGDSFGFDIFNDTRTVATGRAPGTPAATVHRQVVGRVDGVFPRINEKLPMKYKDLHLARKIGSSNEMDPKGVDHLRKQQQFMGQRAANFRLIQLAGMLRGKMYGHVSGDDVYYDFTSASAAYTVDWRIPSGNLSQLNMLGGGNLVSGSWADPGTDIPSQLTDIAAAFEELNGTSVELAVLTSAQWKNVKNNDFVRSQAGINDSAWVEDTPPNGMAQDGAGKKIRAYRLRGNEQILFVVTDQVLELGLQGSTTRTKLVGSTNVWFGPMPSAEYFEMIEGSEVVVPSNGESREVTGLFAYTKEVDDPAAVMLYTVDSAIVANYVPSASAYATVEF